MKIKKESSLIRAKSGATSRSKAPDYSLLPTEVDLDIIARLQYGMEHGHSRNNWKLAKNDAGFVQERLNHAETHLRKVQDRTGTFEDFQAVLCNLAMISWYIRNGNGAKEAFPHLFEMKEEK